MSNKITISIPDVVGETANQVEQTIRQYAPADSVSVETYETEPQSTEEWIARVRHADGIVLGWSLPDEVLEAASNLKAISFLGTGIADQVSLPKCESLGVEAYNVTGYGDNAVAEHTIALLFAAWHQVPFLDREVHSGRWPEVTRKELQGSTLGIIGYGGIGLRVSEMADALGMKVKVWSRSLEPGTDIPYGNAVSLEEVLRESDAISVHLALNPQTEGFIDAQAFDMMKDGVVFLNTARGDIVDTHELVNALKSGKVASTGVDVFSSEPVSSDNPLLGIPGAVLTPHVAYNTENAVSNLADIGAKNIIKHFWPNEIQ